MEPEQPVSVVSAWQEAAKDRDFGRLAGLSDPGIELAGPRGSGYGHELLRDWLARAGLSLETLRAFASGGAVVLAQHGVWRAVETGEFIGEADVASHFRVTGDRVAYLSRHDDPGAALEEAGLGFADEVGG